MIMQNILILTASFGMGHKSVSNAIKEQIELQNNNFNVEIVDILDVFNPALNNVGSKIYYNLTERYPLVYNTIYDIKKTNKNNLFDILLCATYYKKLHKYIEAFSPNLIISTFPLCSCAVSMIKKMCKLDTKMITVITDISDSWEWLYNGTNLYMVPSKEVKDKLIAKGIDKDIIKVTGIPVKDRFLHSKQNIEKNTLLIIATGMTEQDLSDDVLRKIDNYNSLKTVIVTGRNQDLYSKLSLKLYKNIEVLGFVNNIDELMDKSIFLMTKPGGITVFEAINKELPLLVKDSGIGQEKGNVDFIRKNNLGLVINNSNDLLEIINEYMRDPNKNIEFSQNMRKIRRDFNPSKVIECILEYTN